MRMNEKKTLYVYNNNNNYIYNYKSQFNYKVLL